MMAPIAKIPAHMRPVTMPSRVGRGGLSHQGRVRRIDAERDGWCAVRQQVDPQQLAGDQRKHDGGAGGSRPIRFASNTPKNIVMTSPMFEDSR